MSNVTSLLRNAGFPAPVFCCCLLLPWSGVSAQESGKGSDKDASGASLEEVVVTATKREENLQRVPISITAITGSELASRGIQNASDLRMGVPSLQINSPWGETQPNFTLRGVGVSNEFNANVASPIGVYFDEGYETLRAAHGVQLYDLERVEVVKGPQGTLYGRNTTGGAVNIISKQPRLDGNDAYVTLGYGNYNRQSVSAAVETTLKEDELGIRVSGTRVLRDGYLQSQNAAYGVNNPFVGNRDFASEDLTSGRIIVRAKPVQNVDLSLKIYSGRSNPVGSAPLSEFPYFNNTNGAGTLPGAPGQPFARSELQDDEVLSPGGGRYLTTTHGVQLNAKWTVNDHWSLTSVTNYADNLFDIYIDFAGSPLDIGRVSPYQSKQQEYNADVHLNYDTDLLHLVAGVFAGADTIKTFNHFLFFKYLNDVPGPERFAPGVTSAIDIEQRYNQYRQSDAAYAEAKYVATEKLSLTTGVRVTTDYSRMKDFSALWFDSAGNPAVYIISSDPNPTRAPLAPDAYVPQLARRTNSVSGRFIADYKLTEETLLYGSYSRGYRAGAFNGQAILSPTQIFLTKPETLDAVEVGEKSRFWNNRAQLNASIFYYNYKNQQIESAENGVSVLQSLNSKIYGAELEAEARLTDRLHAATSIGYLHTRLNDGQTVNGVDVSGAELPFAPQLTFNINGNYQLLRTSAGTLSIRGEAQYTSRQYFEPINDRGITNGVEIGPIRFGQKAYWIENARLTFDTEHLSVSAWIKNLADKFYYGYGINTEGFSFNDYLIRGEPRTFGGEVTFRW